MIVSVYCPSKDKHFSLNVGVDLTLDGLLVLCSTECGIAPQGMRLFLNNQPLTDSKRTLKSYNVAENDLFVLQIAVLPAASQIPKLDFSNVQVPGTASTSQQQTAQASSSRGLSQQSAGSHGNMDDPAMLRDRLLNSPYDIAVLKERNPTFAEALLSGDLDRFTAEFQKIRDANAKAQLEKIQMLNADPMNLDVQKKIAEEIKRKNIEENMNMAIEEAPESFGQVIMLWINLKVNGHHVKAFVDSGAQMTIMSANCAQRCNIMRLVDKRWEGIAKGVGTQKILGRIHLAQIQIENVFLQCSFSVLEEQPMDVLLGLDMLKRHLCVIDLKENCLTIGTTSTKTQFLPESELPSHGRLHDPNAASTSGGAKTEEEEINDALLKSVAEATKREEGSPDSAPAPKMFKSPDVANPHSSSSNQSSVEEKIKQLIGMGFARAAAEEELRKVDGDLQRAIVSLLMKNMNKSR